MVNWINSWRSGNKKNKHSISFRLGKLTIFELNICPCNEERCTKFRFMILNFGFEI
jgi:hypothetical protein